MIVIAKRRDNTRKTYRLNFLIFIERRFPIIEPTALYRSIIAASDPVFPRLATEYSIAFCDIIVAIVIISETNIIMRKYFFTMNTKSAQKFFLYAIALCLVEIRVSSDFNVS